MEQPVQQKFDSPQKDQIYHILSNHRRRYVIHFLKGQDEPVSLSDIAEQVAAWEQDKPISELTSDERKRVYTSLQQTHLPRLEDADVIELDRDMIDLTEDVDELEIYLDIVPSGSIPWAVYYLGLSVVSSILFAGVWSGIIPDEPIPPLVWMALVIGAFLFSAVAHVIHNRRYRLGQNDGPPA